MQTYKVTGTIHYFNAAGNRQSADVSEMEVISTSNEVKMQNLAKQQWAMANNVSLGSIEGWGNFKSRPLSEDEQARRLGAVQKGLGI